VAGRLEFDGHDAGEEEAAYHWGFRYPCNSFAYVSGECAPGSSAGDVAVYETPGLPEEKYCGHHETDKGFVHPLRSDERLHCAVASIGRIVFQ
jgi:hypothetical protein